MFDEAVGFVEELIPQSQTHSIIVWPYHKNPGVVKGSLQRFCTCPSSEQKNKIHRAKRRGTAPISIYTQVRNQARKWRNSCHLL